jgi:hypothetical protein
MFVLWFYTGMSSRVRTVYLFSVCVISLFCSRSIVSALLWFSNLLKYLVSHFFISLSSVFVYRSSWIMWLCMYQGAFGMDRTVLDWKRWGISMFEMEATLIAEVHRTIWVWVLLCIGGVCFLLIVLIFFRVGSASVSFSAERFSYGFDVLCPCLSSIEVHAQVLHFIFLGKINMAHVHYVEWI